MRLEVPEDLHRNDAGVAAIGYEHTGETLINLAMRRVGLESLSDKDVLDVGCGVRFTQTIINREIPIGSYTGLEVHQPIIDFLNERVAPYDRRFRFFHWDVRHELFNPNGIELATLGELPLQESFDLIWLFSVFTHLNPVDASVMLRLLRKHIREGGKLLFSAFIDENLAGFDDRVKGRLLVNAYYGREYMESLIDQAGWQVDRFFEPDGSQYIMACFVCSTR